MSPVHSFPDPRPSALQAIKDLIKLPYRTLRRAGISDRLPALPGRRGWRTAIPPRLHLSIMRGLIPYTYRDVPMQKHPMDIALYTRLIWETKPATIIEIGSLAGGSAVWMADMLRTFDVEGQIVSIDVTPPAPNYHPQNVKFLSGDANNLAATLRAQFLATMPRPWLVIEDAGHEYPASLAVLEFFHPLLRSGEYIVVEDANMTEMGVDARYDGGPARAIAEFLQARGADYEIDARYCDQYGRNVTGNPNGYLKRR